FADSDIARIVEWGRSPPVGEVLWLAQRLPTEASSSNP
ncbi:hypothetical protein TNCV_2430561, partial [Trichonephila clavipes]